MGTKRVTKFTVEKGTNGPKQLNESGILFCLFKPERLKIQPRETKKALLNFNVYIPKDIFTIIFPIRLYKKKKI